MPSWSRGDGPRGRQRYIVAPSTSVSLIDPLDLSPMVWLDARAAYINAGSPSNNDLVATAIDRSGNSREFINAFSSYQPQWKTSQFGSEPGVQFTQASPSYLAHEGGTIATPSGVTYWAVIKTSTSDTSSANPNINAPMTVMGDSGGNTSFNLGLNGNEVEACYWNGAWASHVSSGLSLANGSPHTIAATLTSGGALKVYADGVQVKSASGLSYYGAMTFYIVGAGYGTFDAFNGLIAEAMLFGSALTAQNITDLHARARSTWGAP